MMKQPEEEEEEASVLVVWEGAATTAVIRCILIHAKEDKEQWGLLEKSFSGTAGQKGPDHHLEAAMLRWTMESRTMNSSPQKLAHEVLYPEG